MDYGVIREGAPEEEVAEDLFAVLGQLVLLQLATMVLKRQNDRQVGRYKCCVSDC